MWKPKDSGSGKGNIASQPVTNNTYDWLVGRFVKSVNLKRYSGSGIAWGGNRAVFAGGRTSGGVTNIMDYVNINILSNAIDFGDLVTILECFPGCSNGSRGVFAGGVYGTSHNLIEYITFSICSNAINFGQLLYTPTTMPGICSNGIRGIIGGGSSTVNNIEYVTISVTSNSTDFGDITVIRYRTSACSNSTRGVFGGGVNASDASLNVLDYVTIATTGNATDFGDFTAITRDTAACSSETRGVFVTPDIGGSQYITITTLGNAVTFGSCTNISRYMSNGASNGVRGVFAGGPSVENNYIDCITIANLNSSMDFGDLTVGRYCVGSASGN